jgi:hypothetical protein
MSDWGPPAKGKPYYLHTWINLARRRESGYAVFSEALPCLLRSVGLSNISEDDWDPVPAAAADSWNAPPAAAVSTQQNGKHLNEA